MNKTGFCLSLLLASVSFCAVADTAAPEVLANYGDSIAVTNVDFAAALRGLPENARNQARDNPKSATGILDTVLLNRVLAQQAREMGLDQGPEAQAELHQVADRSLAVRRMEAFEASLKIPDYAKAAKEQYEVHKDRYVEPEMVHTAHILITKQGRDAAEARKLAEHVHAEAMAGADFAALAEKYSEDPGSKTQGGDLGFFARGRMVKDFEQAAFALKNPGEISPVVESPFGFHVIKFIEHKTSRPIAFDEVKDQIIAPMRAQFVNAEKLRFISALRNDPKIKLNTVAIDRLIGTHPNGQPADAAPAPRPSGK